MDKKEIERFISKQKVGFICSVDQDGFPNVKAMLMPRKRNGLKEFWFSTNMSSMRVHQYLENPRASNLVALSVIFSVPVDSILAVESQGC